MPRNKVVGKNTRPGSTKALGRKKQPKKTTAQLRKVAKDNTTNRQNGVYGKLTGMKKDLSHKSDGTTTYENTHDNRARQGSNGKSTKKPVKRKAPAKKTKK